MDVIEFPSVEDFMATPGSLSDQRPIFCNTASGNVTEVM